MVIGLMRGRYYKRLLDFGSGPGIFQKELKLHSAKVRKYEIGDWWHPQWSFDCVICASVLEFVQLNQTLKLISSVMRPKGDLIVASPLDNALTKFLFRSIGDTKPRKSHKEIMAAVSKYFKVLEYKEWFGVYFALKVQKL